MKRVIISALVSILTPTLATAQLSGNGFYRVQNNASHRYITINDDIIGQVNKSSTTADLSNIVTWRGFDYVKSNPASIIYIESVSGKYNLSAQGTSVYKIAGGRTYIDITDKGGNTYEFSVSYSGAKIKLYDDSKSADKGGVRQLTDLDWTILFTCVMGYRLGLWDIPYLNTEGLTVKDKIAWINQFNKSKKKFTENTWKDCRKQDRASQMLPRELITDTLESMQNYKHE